MPGLGGVIPTKAAIGVILVVALVAFEIFNFDTTQFALESLLGEMRFMGIMWATILAIAFCSIDFAGLIRLFTPEQGSQEPKAVWYLTGAWLLGATLNAVMTWWAVNLTLLQHDFGNEVLSREQLLLWVPIFVAVLVWLTRILFIGAFSVAGEQLFDIHGTSRQTRPVKAKKAPRNTAVTRANAPKRKPAPVRAKPAPKPQPRTLSAQPDVTYEDFNQDVTPMPQTAAPPKSRVRQRPPRPSPVRRSPMSGIHARPRN
ncbi:MAG TPA: hypothetical protein ENK32_07150, partial [Anaerolineae bacterium]|nr:hypothetical protein [Anaerolineae bacterium]